MKQLNIKIINFEVFERICKYQLKKYLKNLNRPLLESILNEGIPSLDKNNLSKFVKWSFLKLKLPDCAIKINENQFYIKHLDSCNFIIINNEYKYFKVNN